MAQGGGQHRSQVLLVVDDQQVLSGHGAILACVAGSWLRAR